MCQLEESSILHNSIVNTITMDSSHHNGTVSAAVSRQQRVETAAATIAERCTLQGDRLDLLLDILMCRGCVMIN